MSQTPKISVIIPVYNVEKYLPICLESIINQTYRNLEIILVNDGSTDNCGIICDEYSNIDKRITVIHKENGGQSSARNVGLDICSGEYIGFVDSDDYIHPKTYEIAFDVITKEDFDFVEWEYKPVHSVESFDEIIDYDYEIHTMYDVLLGIINWKKHYYSPCNKLYRRKSIINLRFPRGKIMEDVFFLNNFIDKFNKVGYIPLTMYHYYQRKYSTTRTSYTIEHMADFEAFNETYSICKTQYPELLELQLEEIVMRFFLRLNIINNQNNDRDNCIKQKLINIVLQNYNDIITTKTISKSSKKDIILAQKDKEAFMKKQKNGILRK